MIYCLPEGKINCVNVSLTGLSVFLSFFYLAKTKAQENFRRTRRLLLLRATRTQGTQGEKQQKQRSYTEI